MMPPKSLCVNFTSAIGMDVVTPTPTRNSKKTPRRTKLNPVNFGHVDLSSLMTKNKENAFEGNYMHLCPEYSEHFALSVTIGMPPPPSSGKGKRGFEGTKETPSSKAKRMRTGASPMPQFAMPTPPMPLNNKR